MSLSLELKQCLRLSGVLYLNFQLHLPVPPASTVLSICTVIGLLSIHSSHSSLAFASFLPLHLISRASSTPCPGLGKVHHHPQVRDDILVHCCKVWNIWSSFYRKHVASPSLLMTRRNGRVWSTQALNTQITSTVSPKFLSPKSELSSVSLYKQELLKG